MSYYGRRLASDTDSGLTGGTSNNNQVGQRYKAMPENGWATHVGILGGKNVGQPNLTWRGAIFDLSATGLDDRLKYTNAYTVTNQMSFGGDGDLIEAALTEPLMLFSGTKYGLGFSVTGGVFRYGMKQAANNPGEVDDYYFHKKNNASSIPTDPFAAASSSYEGAIDLYVQYNANNKPTTTIGTMSPSGTITDATPHILGDFDDANESTGDKMKQFRVQVRKVSNGSIVWDSTQNATSTEQDNKRFDTIYAGTALIAGSQYEFRYQVSDQHGEWSGWSHETGSTWRTFTLNAGGSVSTASGTPTGKQETQTPGPFTGVWSHASLSANTVQLRIRQGTTTIRQSSEIGVAAIPNGGAISIAWAGLGFAALSWGQSLSYSIRARDTSGLWSDWSADRAFTTNASPTIPSSLTPANGQVVSARPILRCKVTDADDTTASGLAVSARIKNSAGTVLFTRAMTSVGSGWWEYQTTATDLASFAVYKWDANATDGTITTAFSAEQTFTYAAGPVITVTAPTAAQVLTTNTPTYSFSQDQTQASYSVSVHEWDAVADESLGEIYNSGTIIQAAASGVTVNHQQPSGYLHNGHTYRIFITSTTNLAVSATHAGVTFSLNLGVVSAPTGALASPILVNNDTLPSAILISFDEPPYSSDYFRGTVITKRPEGTDISKAIVLARLTSTSQISFIDYYVKPGQTFTYGIAFTALLGTDETESDVVEVSAGITLDAITITSVDDGALHICLRYGEPMQLEHDGDTLEVLPWGQSEPHVYVGDLDAHTITGTFELQNDRFSTGASDLLILREIHGAHHTVCYRDYYNDLIFGVMTLKERKGQRGVYAIVEIRIRQNDHKEGE